MKRKSVEPAAETQPLTFGPIIIANNILSRAFAEQVDVTPMELQRLLYIAASECAKSTGALGSPEEIRGD